LERLGIESSDEEAADDVEVAGEEADKDDMSDDEEENESDENQDSREKSRPRLESSDEEEVEVVNDESDAEEADTVKDKAKKSWRPHKRLLKVKSFKHEWLQKSISGSRTSLWLKSHPTTSNKALCTVCPKVMREGFSTNEGWKAVIQHGTGAKHLEQLKQSQENPLWRKPGTKPVKITEGLKKMEEVSKR